VKVVAIRNNSSRATEKRKGKKCEDVVMAADKFLNGQKNRRDGERRKKKEEEERRRKKKKKGQIRNRKIQKGEEQVISSQQGSRALNPRTTEEQKSGQR
jgi:hypothetical protein